MAKIIDILRKSSRFRISLPFFSYEISLDDLSNTKNVDERIAKLGAIKKDLEAAVLAVDALQDEAEERRAEKNSLADTIAKLKEEQTATQVLLKIPEETFTRVLAKANSKGKWRGRLEGIIIGILTGIASSVVVWYLTKPDSFR